MLNKLCRIYGIRPYDITKILADRCVKTKKDRSRSSSHPEVFCWVVGVMALKLLVSSYLGPLSLLLAGDALVEKCQNLGNVELDVFEVEVFLTILLHLK